LVNAASTGNSFVLVNSPAISSLTTPINHGPGFWAFTKQSGNHIDGYTENVASGGTTAAPNLARGNFIRYVSTSVGAAHIIPAPSPAIPYRGEKLEIQFFNSAGAVTGWNLNAIFVLAGAVAVPTANLAKTTIVFSWDSDSSVWREVSRAQTV
jgi:hypothetical protein